MENKPEETTPHNPVEGETPEVKDVEEVIVEDKQEETLSSEDIAELQKKADVSSQNFERAKKAESELKELKNLPENDSSSEFEDEEVNKLKSDVTALQSELGQNKLVKKYPQLEEAWDDFEKYHQDPENSGMKLETAAKSFLVDKGLLGERRKGLERATGGDKTPQKSGMSVEDVEKIRKNDGQKYRDMLKKGLIKFK